MPNAEYSLDDPREQVLTKLAAELIDVTLAKHSHRDPQLLLEMRYFLMDELLLSPGGREMLRNALVDSVQDASATLGPKELASEKEASQ